MSDVVRVDVPFRKSSYSGGGNQNCVEVGFRKSSYSGGGNQACVEVANRGGGFVVRDSKDAAGPVLVGFSASDWAAFLTGVRSGRLAR